MARIVVTGRSTDSQDEPTDGETVVLAMEPGRDRTLLAEWLEALPAVGVRTAAGPRDLPAEYDLCVLDRSSLESVRPVLQRRAEESGSVYLPHVLVVPPTEGDERPRITVTDTDMFVKDVVYLPTEKAVLRRRFENLLQTRRASLKLAERKHQYEQLVALTPETILLVRERVIRYTNEAGSDLFGVDDPAAVQGESLRSFVAPDDRERLDGTLAGLAAADHAERSEYVELELRSATGESRHVEMTGVRVVYDGEPATQLVVRDLTATRKRKRQLTLFGRAIEAAAQGITIADAQQSDEPLIYANEGFGRITGYEIDEILGRNCRFLQGENTDPETVSQVRAAIDDRRPVTVEILNYRRDGSPFWNRLNIVPVEDDSGTVTHFLGLQRDVTDRKEREQQLTVLNRILRHNLRNKMNVIQAYADRLTSVEGARESAAIIEKASADLLRISEQIHRFDPLGTSRSSEMHTVDLAATLIEGVSALQERHPDADLEASLSEAAPVRASKGLDAALENLLGLLESSETPAFDLDVECDGDAVYLTVVDRGGAISQNSLEVVASGTETDLAHLQGVELWVLRWTIERSHGEFTVDTGGEWPRLRIRLLRADDESAGDPS